MGTRRITIQVDETVGDYEALHALLDVVAIGQISKGAKGKDHYCWHTSFSNGIHISTKPKYGTDSDRFEIYTSKG